MSKRFNNKDSHGKKNNNQFQREQRDQMKQEFVRGLSEAREMHENASTTFIELIRDKLSQVDTIMGNVSSIENEIDDIIKLIDNYLIDKTPAEELVKRESVPETMLREYKQTREEPSNGEPFSLLDYVKEEE